MIGQSAISLEVPVNCNSWTSVCCLLFIKFSMISNIVKFLRSLFIYLFSKHQVSPLCQAESLGVRREFIDIRKAERKIWSFLC